MYIPLYNPNEPKYLVHFKFKRIAIITVFLPLAGFTVCVLLSIIKDFKSANFTHCQVFNFLPSVSAAIGSFYPQNWIWKFTIGIHSIPRYIISILYFNYNRSIIDERIHALVFISWLLNMLEISCLIGLSSWSSTENYPVHKTCFVTFVIASQLYMLLLCILLKRYRWTKPTETELFSLKLKWILLSVNVISIFFASYFFMRHNSYCEPFIYSLFAASEYIVILTNMGYHMTSCYDFGDKHIFIKKMGITVD